MAGSRDEPVWVPGDAALGKVAGVGGVPRIESSGQPAEVIAADGWDVAASDALVRFLAGTQLA